MLILNFTKHEPSMLFKRFSFIKSAFLMIDEINNSGPLFIHQNQNSV